MSTVYDDTVEMISEFESNLDELCSTAKTYMDAYELYCSYVMKDSDLLKKRMKEKVIRAVNSDES